MNAGRRLLRRFPSLPGTHSLLFEHLGHVVHIHGIFPKGESDIHLGWALWFALVQLVSKFRLCNLLALFTAMNVEVHGFALKSKLFKTGNVNSKVPIGLLLQTIR